MRNLFMVLFLLLGSLFSQTLFAVHAKVIYWGGMNGGLGHVAVAVFKDMSGKEAVYISTSPSEDHFSMQIKRHTVYILPEISLSDREFLQFKREAKDYLDHFRYSLLFNNCAHLVDTTLRGLGYQYPHHTFFGTFRPKNLIKGIKTISVKSYSSSHKR